MNYSRRIEHEYEKLSDGLSQDIGIYKKTTDMRSFYAFIRGPNDSPYEGGYFKIFIHLNKDYPFSPPVMKFMTKVYHPNISSQTGAICLDILKNKWTAAMSIATTLISIQALLTSAVPEDPQDHPVAVIYLENRDLYDETVRRWTKEYAIEDNITDDEKMLERVSTLFHNENEVFACAATNCWDETKLIQTLKNKK